MDSPTDLTKSTYEDPDIVAGYIENNAYNPKMYEAIEAFASLVEGENPAVIDLGCGPGQDSYKFAELGFETVGIDYSEQMIENAKKLHTVDNPPEFYVMDMREIGKKFPADKFDAAWVCASLLHITKKDTPLVLEGLKKIVKNGGQIYIGLKSGDEDELIVEETKYGKYMQRKFVFWQKEEFKNLLEDLNFKLKNFTKIETKDTGGIETSWLNYYIEVVK